MLTMLSIIFVFTTIILIKVFSSIEDRKRERCEKEGHVFKPIQLKIRKEGGDLPRVVVTDYLATFNKCARCGYRDPESLELEEVDWFHSCTMPKSMWNEIRNNGYLILKD